VVGVIDAVLETYRDLRHSGESFADALKRVGHEPFKRAAHASRSPAAPLTHTEHCPA
jgi:sulfite reductase (NADPH) hemoprotein beta-component